MNLRVMVSSTGIIFIVVLLLGMGRNGYAANAAASASPQPDTSKSGAEDTGRHDKQAVGPHAGEFTEDTTGIQFIAVNGGCFSMGDTFGDGEKDERPVHKTCISDFAISKYDITVGQFRRFAESAGYRTEAEKEGGCFVFNGTDWTKQAGNNWRSPSFTQNDRHPVSCVNWNDAQAFVNWMNTLGSRRYRLPREAEWEYAARSGGKKERFAGFNDKHQLYKYANFCDSNCDARWKTTEQNDRYNGTSPVGSYLPNSLGLYDMTGNLWQWVEDWYSESYYGISPKDNPGGPRSGTDRAVRGGSWLSEPADVRAADRNNCAPDYSAFDIGFRLVSPVN